MKEKLSFSTNALRDIIGWLNKDYIVCLYSSKKTRIFFSKETLNEITDEKMIYINLDGDPSLLDEGEWPYYIKGVGFYDYKSTDKVPTNEENIYTFKLS